MTIGEFQRLIERVYGARDSGRGMGGTFLWFVEEIGELAEAIRTGDRDAKLEEFADAMAWLVSLASIEGVDIEKAVTLKYGGGCPKCRETPCRCEDPSKTIA